MARSSHLNQTKSLVRIVFVLILYMNIIHNSTIIFRRQVRLFVYSRAILITNFTAKINISILYLMM